MDRLKLQNNGTSRPCEAGIKESGLFQEAFQLGQRARRRVEGGHERFPLRRVKTEGPPVGQRLIGARESALQHEFAHRAMRNSSCGLQCTLGVARQPKIEFFTVILRIAIVPDNV
jgi:hypothetical protein